MPVCRLGRGVGCRVLIPDADGGSCCWVLLPGAEALTGAQWRVLLANARCRVLMAVLISDADAGCRVLTPGAAKKFWTGRCGL